MLLMGYGPAEECYVWSENLWENVRKRKYKEKV